MNAVSKRIASSLSVLLVLASADAIADGPIPPKAAAANKASAKGCSNRSLKGRYGVALEGRLIEVIPGPVSVVGVMDSDGSGKFTGTGATNFNADIKQNVSYTGVYAVGADCTGTGTLSWPTMGINLDVYFIIIGIGNNQEIRFVNTSLPAVVHGSAKRMAR